MKTPPGNKIMFSDGGMGRLHAVSNDKNPHVKTVKIVSCFLNLCLLRYYN